ncbi:MAG: MEDS domain-containing protein, partial [Thermodesulfobacteriota bacterium]
MKNFNPDVINMKESIFSYFDSIKMNDHIAHIYSKNSERFELGARFIADGLRLNQKCAVISDKKAHSDIISRIGLYDIDLEKYKNKEKFIEINLDNKGVTETNPDYLLNIIEELVSKKPGEKEDEITRIVLSRKIAFLNLNENYQLNLEARLNLLTVNNPLIVINQFE